MENLTLPRHNEGKRDEGKPRVTNPTGLCKWLAEQGREDIVKKTLLKDTKDRKLR